jgi:hypothetical protein
MVVFVETLREDLLLELQGGKNNPPWPETMGDCVVLFEFFTP